MFTPNSGDKCPLFYAKAIVKLVFPELRARELTPQWPTQQCRLCVLSSSKTKPIWGGWGPGGGVFVPGIVWKRNDRGRLKSSEQAHLGLPPIAVNVVVCVLVFAQAADPRIKLFEGPMTASNAFFFGGGGGETEGVGKPWGGGAPATLWTR